MSDPNKELLETAGKVTIGAVAAWFVPRALGRMLAYWRRPGKYAVLMELVARNSNAITGLNDTMKEIKIAFDEMRDSQRKLADTQAIFVVNQRHLFDSDPVARWWTDASGKFKDANRALCELLGLTADQMRSNNGHGWLHGVFSEQQNRVLKEFLEAMRSDQGFFTSNFAIPQPGGVLKNVLAQGEVIRNDAGQIVGMTGTITPVPIPHADPI